MAFNLFKFPNKPTRQFSIPLRYYDPEQERKKEREERIRKELNTEQNITNAGYYRSSIKGSFRANRGSGSVSGRRKDNMTLRLILIVFILLVVIYFILK